MNFEQPFIQKIDKEEKIEKEREILPLPEYVYNAQTALESFLKLKPEEKILLLKDKETNKETLAIFERAIENIGSLYKEVALDSKTKKREIEDLLKSVQAVIDLSIKSCKATRDIYEDIEKFGNRLLSCLDLEPEAFKNGGPMTERVEDLEYRLNKLEAILKEAAGFKITSVYGTNLELGLRPFKERRWYKDTGVIEKPGQWDNFPGGEIFTTPDERNVNGILVLPAVDSEIVKEQGVDELVWIKIKNGRITSIQGGKSAEKLRKKLDEAALKEYKEQKDPLNVYQCAELGFGANSKARSRVADPEQPYNFPGVSTVEAEKRLGTIHIAFGDTKHGEEGAEGFIEAGVHYDFVIPRNGLTVEMFENEEDFEKKKNGRRIISDGGLLF